MNSEKKTDDGVALYSVPRLARRWDVSEETVRRRIWTNKLKAVRIDNMVRVPLEEIRRYEAAFPAA
jgi:hypothetical protein